MDSEIIIGIMAKHPRKGSVKTRLVPPLSYSQAAGLYEALLLDTIDTVKKLNDNYGKAVFYHPDGTREYFNNITENDWFLVAQSGKDLGERLMNAFLKFSHFETPVVIIGSDSPALPENYIKKSITCLINNDFVLGPTEDGGFYLIAIKEIDKILVENIFRGIRWSTDKALDDIKNNIGKTSKDYALINKWYDIDTVQDIKRYRMELKENKVLSGSSGNNIKSFVTKMYKK